ncbi:MAG: YqgE/AlgH family protein [Pedobacter sp.]|nr:YqgE/AlgH family protein [Chitinophagaceae bacterium]
MIDALTPGLLLISDPFLKDSNFLRTTVLLCENNTEGSVGFVFNKPFNLTLGDLVDGLEGINFPVYEGGPVQKTSIHFIHKCPDIILDGAAIGNGIFWGGNFEQVKALLKTNRLTQKDIRFFIGYSGWGTGQLEAEIAEKSWITRACNSRLIFSQNAEQIWKDALKGLGGEYELMPNYPIDPQLN